MEWNLIHGDKFYKVSVSSQSGKRRVEIEGKSLELEAQELAENAFLLQMRNRVFPVYVIPDAEKIHVVIQGRQFTFLRQRETDFRAAPGAAQGAGPAQRKGAISSPMPGKIVKIMISEGEEVEENQSLVIVEAMKMENELRAPFRGWVKRVHASEEDQVDAGQTIVELEAMEVQAG